MEVQLIALNLPGGRQNTQVLIKAMLLVSMGNMSAVFCLQNIAISCKTLAFQGLWAGLEGALPVHVSPPFIESMEAEKGSPVIRSNWFWFNLCHNLQQFDHPLKGHW